MSKLFILSNDLRITIVANIKSRDFFLFNRTCQSRDILGLNTTISMVFHLLHIALCCAKASKTLHTSLDEDAILLYSYSTSAKDINHLCIPIIQLYSCVLHVVSAKLQLYNCMYFRHTKVIYSTMLCRVNR